MLKGAWKDPWGYQHPMSVDRFAMKMGRLGTRKNLSIRNGVISGIPRRVMAGDPSWVSQFIKHNAKIIGGAVGGLAGTFLGPLGAIGGAALGKVLAGGGGGGSGGSTKIATPNPAPLRQLMFRPTATSGMGKAAGMTAALAPLPPSYLPGNPMVIPSEIGQYLPGGSSPIFDIPTDTGGSTDDGSDTPAPVVAIPSSGGGSMLYHHFFGTSNSKAIPVSQTNGMRPSGYHVNKHGYYLKTISTWLPPGSVWVKGRRRNPLNPRALHRSIARLISAKHAVKTLGLLQVPKRHVKRRFGRPAGRKLLKAG